MPPLPVPASLFRPCLVPSYRVQHYGDYPGYTAELFAVIEQCNGQLRGVQKILKASVK
ncbi:hypothetical protein [Limnobaculum allomyrinae]